MAIKFILKIIAHFIRNNDLVATADLVGGAVSSETWHRRLGHINSADFEKIKNGAVKGFNCFDRNKKGMCNRVTCCEGKQSWLPLKHKGTRAELPLEVIHGDVCGSIETKTIDGSKYFFLSVDDKSVGVGKIQNDSMTNVSQQDQSEMAS